MKAQFSRNLGFLSPEEQQKLEQSKVAIAGAGGDGGALAIAMARMGVGEIRLADPDIFEDENLNRQAVSTIETIGRNKAEAVGEYISKINPLAKLVVLKEGINQSNVKEFVDGADLVIDEIDYSQHAAGVMLAREARAANIPDLMALNIGFGATVTTYHPKGHTLEKTLGLSETAPIEQIARQEVPLSKWLPYIPSYGDLEVFKVVAEGKLPAPSIAPGVAIAAAVGSSQAFLNLVKEVDNHRPKPVYAPNVMVMDAMTGESKTVKQTARSHNFHLAKMAARSLTGRNPSTGYRDLQDQAENGKDIYMSRESEEAFKKVNPAHIGLLNDTLKSPSAHNAQPWQIKPVGDHETYEVHYDQNDTLPEDPHSKDAYLTMGAFVETMSLQAPNHGLSVEFSPEFSKTGNDLYIGRVAIRGFSEGVPVDPLSELVGSRLTNRNKYTKEVLTPKLEQALQDLGNTLVDSKSLKDVIKDSSIDLWRSQRYLDDLKAWFRENENAEDGITPPPFNISKSDIVALKFAFKHGAFKSRVMGYLYSSRDIGVFTSSPQAAVMTAPEMSPPVLFDAGRRLLKSWVNIVSAGYSYQPFSVAVDNKEAAARVAEIAGVDETPVALYRIGRAKKPPRGYSGRKPLEKVLISD
jgi:molybdopterin/thiamine biosynthesis adenylyltransferase